MQYVHLWCYCEWTFVSNYWIFFSIFFYHKTLITILFFADCYDIYFRMHHLIYTTIDYLMTLFLHDMNVELKVDVQKKATKIY